MHGEILHRAGAVRCRPAARSRFEYMDTANNELATDWALV